MRPDPRNPARLCAALLVSLALEAPAPALAAKDCSHTSTGLVPLNDLGSGLYQGVPGGLYAGGSNQHPYPHLFDGLRIARGIVPLDTLGQSDPTGGRIVLLGLGGNNASLEFAVFASSVASDPTRNPRLAVVNGAAGGFDLLDAADPQSAYWDTVASRLRAAGASPAQVQIGWMKMYVEDALGDFTASTDSTSRLLTRAVRNARTRLPNLELLYLTPRIYGGYAGNAGLAEPNAYWTGFAFRQVILSQVSGDSLNFDPARGPVVAPWIDWGPYLWADGMQPRSDGLTWACSEFTGNGYVPSQSGRAAFADNLLAFFQRAVTATPCYLNSSTLDVPSGGAPGAVSLAAAPNPASSGVTLRITLASGPWTVRLLDLQGRQLRAYAGDGPADVRWDLLDDSGARVRAGVYWARLHTKQGGVSRTLVVR